jgi:hypothetical protein
MPRSTEEHELVITRLDQALTFAFALEDERRRSADVDRLRGFAEVARARISAHPISLVPQRSPSPLGMHGSILAGIMNSLQKAVREAVMPQQRDLSTEWAHLPSLLSAKALDDAQRQHVPAFAILVRRVLQRIDGGFPEEAKPFVSLQQVSAVLWAVLPEVRGLRTVPIFVPAMARAMHTAFHESLKTALRRWDDGQRPGVQLNEYFADAMQAFQREIESRLGVSVMRELFDEARRLAISLEENYTWAALSSDWPSAEDWLKLYAGMNLKGIANDKKFTRHREDGSPSVADAHASLLSYLQWITPMPATERRSQAYFVTDGQRFAVDGVELPQKHALLAVPVDAPLPDVDELLRHFGIYLTTQRAKHCRDTGSRLNAMEAVSRRRLIQETARSRQPDRVLLHDKSSILAQLCALRALELARLPRSRSSSIKARDLEIGEWIAEAGFRYSAESVRKAREHLPQLLQTVRAHLSSD